MKLTQALYVRQLLAKLHPPLPKNPKDSQQLLNILESSFRKRLDETHPSPRERNMESLHKDIPLASSQSSSYATHHHLNSVLTHPLLDNKLDPRLNVGLPGESAVERFDNAYSAGAVTFDLVLNCTKRYLAQTRSREGPGHGRKLGHKLAAWLSTASTETKEAFFLDRILLSQSLRVMAADMDEATVWEWLRIVYERDFSEDARHLKSVNDSRWLAIEDELVSSLMRYSIRRKDLSDAAQQFTQACQYREESGRAAVRPDIVQGDLEYIPMIQSWKRLAASIVLTRTNHGLPANAFDTALQFGVGWFQDPFFCEPCLNIYHPTTPSAQLLCMNLRNGVSAARFSTRLKTSSKGMHRAMLTTLLDGAQLSIKQNLNHDARFLLEFAQSHYPEYTSKPQNVAFGTFEQRFASMWQKIGAPHLPPQRLELT